MLIWRMRWGTEGHSGFRLCLEMDHDRRAGVIWASVEAV